MCLYDRVVSKKAVSSVMRKYCVQACVRGGSQVESRFIVRPIYHLKVLVQGPAAFAINAGFGTVFLFLNFPIRSFCLQPLWCDCSKTSNQINKQICWIVLICIVFLFVAVVSVCLTDINIAVYLQNVFPMIKCVNYEGWNMLLLPFDHLSIFA